MTVPIKDIVECLIKSLTKLDNEDEFELYLDTKKSGELYELQRRISQYTSERTHKIGKKIDEMMKENCPEVYTSYEKVIYTHGNLKLPCGV